jgi:hypothetical protein
MYSLGIDVYINLFIMSINARYSDTVSVIVSSVYQKCMAWRQLLPHHSLNPLTLNDL